MTDVTVLYGSQRGASERAAEAFAMELGDLRVSVHRLDDFLKDPHWTPVVVIFVSSFGIGGAPKGAWDFRSMCDDWLELYSDPDVLKPLEGLALAVCGLGGMLRYDQADQLHQRSLCKQLIAVTQIPTTHDHSWRIPRRYSERSAWPGQTHSQKWAPRMQVLAMIRRPKTFRNGRKQRYHSYEKQSTSHRSKLRISSE